MRTTLIAVILAVALNASAQIKTTTLAANQIPKSIKYTGKVVNAVRYTDKDGEHLVIATETGIKSGKEDGFGEADLYAFHYIVQSKGYKMTWQLHDFIKDCPVEIFANYIPKTFAVTDLNNNDKAEVWLMYKTVCHGDVSPSNMKIIMHEGDKKYAIRGRNKIVAKGMTPEGGEYTFDEAFKTGAELFRKHAIELWNKNLIETFK